MSKKSNIKFKSLISALLVLTMVIGMLPTISVFAAQSNEYVDPADNWLTSNGRTNELDMNATTTYESGAGRQRNSCEKARYLTAAALLCNAVGSR